MSAPTEPAPEVPVTQKREFWALMGYAVALGIFGAFAGLVFVGVIDVGGKWYTDSDSGWFGGHWWWVAVIGMVPFLFPVHSVQPLGMALRAT